MWGPGVAIGREQIPLPRTERGSPVPTPPKKTKHDRERVMGWLQQEN